MTTGEPIRATPSNLRVLRVVAVAGFALAAAFFLSLELVVLIPALQESLWYLGELDERASPLLRAGAPFLLLLPILVIAGAITVALWRWRLNSWRWIGAGYVAVVVTLVYLASDDRAIRHPLTVDDIAPAFPGAEKSFEVLMRYGKKHPLGETFNQVPYRLDPRFKWDIRNAEKWQEAITSKRTELEKNWADLAAQRAWWSELNAFERIGDLTPAHTDAEMISFGVFRAVSQHAVAIASLQALDGRGDEAIDTLLPVLQVGRKLQSPSRTLTRAMVGVVLDRLAMDAAGYVLDHAAVSPDARARLTVALQGSEGEAGARHLLTTEYAMVFGSAEGLGAGDLFDSPGNHSPLRQPFNTLSAFLYNPRATFNLYGDLMVEEQDLIARRQIMQADTQMKNFFKQAGRTRFKNLWGAAFLWKSVPAYTKVSESYWLTQDTRTALRARLSKM